MPDDTLHNAQLDLDALIAAVEVAIATAIKPVPQLLDQPTAIAYVGLSRSGWFRLKSADLLPRSVYITGSGERWRKQDLDNWVGKQKPGRK